MGNVLIPSSSITLKDRGGGTFGSKDLSGIESISGTLVDGGPLVIKGIGFTAKTNAKPLLYWRADDGIAPSALGRTLTWDGFVDSSSTVQVLPNSTQSFRHDWGAGSDAALGNITGLTSTGQYYIYRKIFDDWNFATAVAFRTRIIGVTGTFLVGDTVTGTNSGATGTIQKSTDEGGGTFTVFYEPTPGNFESGEPMTSSSGGAGTNDEGAGLLRSFNYKTIRLISEADSNNMYHAVQGADGPTWRITPEFTDSTFFTTNMQIDTVEATWYDEEIYFQDSAVDVKNGIYNLKVNNAQGYSESQRFITRDTANPSPFTRIVQGQVSNGAQPNTFTYYDTIYIDDTFHSVMIGDAATFSAVTEKAVCIPSAWANEEVTVELRQGGLAGFSGNFLYVIGSSGLPVSTNGFAL